MAPEFIGWLASAILLATLIRQIATQVRDRSARGVSRWLFLGQIAASTGFVTYSALVGDWVFIVTNVCILATAVFGQIVTWRHRRHASAHDVPAAMRDARTGTVDPAHAGDPT
mgnify:CR=1 FL=1